MIALLNAGNEAVKILTNIMQVCVAKKWPAGLNKIGACLDLQESDVIMLHARKVLLKSDTGRLEAGCVPDGGPTGTTD